MPIQLYPKCWRDRDDCEPIHCIDAAPEDLTEEQFMEFDYQPHSFVCCGCVKPEARKTVPQDAFRVCWKTPLTDDMADHDEQDLTHLVSVVSQALAVQATRRTQCPSMTVMTPDGMIEVRPNQYQETVQENSREEMSPKNNGTLDCSRGNAA